jgi:hypothetical protein
MNAPVGWRFAAASVTGSSHTKLGTPCQDCAMTKVFFDGAGREILVVVLSDGAGSAARAEFGSSLACSTITEAAEVHFAAGGTIGEISQQTAKLWLSMVRQAISNRAQDDSAAFKDYACTLLVAVIADDSAAMLQIGDGAIVVDNGDGWTWVHWPQRGEFANTTYFVTDDGAETQMAFDNCRGRIEELAAFSDGIEPLVMQYATQTVFEPFFDKMFPAVRALPENGLDEKLSEALAKYLDSPAICQRTDDDKTLVLATRRPPNDAIQATKLRAQQREPNE